MSYADRLQKLVEYQNSIRTALTEKGATISSNSTFKDFPAAVGTITGDYDGPTPGDIVTNGFGAYIGMMSDATKIVSYAFYSNNSITEAVFPCCTEIKDSAFYRCHSLLTVDMPNLLSTARNAFFCCSSLSKVIIPKITILANGFFYGCYSLSILKLLNTSAISNQAFYMCYNMRALYLLMPSVCNLIRSDALSFTPIDGWWASSVCTKPNVYGSIFVPMSLLESYRKATNWVYYSSRFVGLTDEEISNLDI